MTKISELIRLVQQAEASTRQPTMGGSGTHKALDLLDKAQKLCLAAHKEEQYYRSLIAMHTGYSAEEIDMMIEDAQTPNRYGGDDEVTA